MRYRNFLLLLKISLVFCTVISTSLADEDYSTPSPEKATGFYADLGWRTSAGVANALEAAKKVLEQQPDADIEFLVHGKDMRLFIDGATRRKPRIVALSQQLAAQGAKFRVCDHALSFKGVELKDFPAHFETVDYVPERVTELRSHGYQALHQPPR